MFILNFNFLVFLSVFIGFIPVHASAQQPIVAPAEKALEVQKQDLTIKKKNGEDLTFFVELAVTPQEQAKGLMYRTELADDAGMLFIFQDEAPRSFWMKNTLIPLDMIFIKRSGEILNIHQNAIPHDLTPVQSKGDAFAVLEIAGGRSEELGLIAGDRIVHPAFSVMVLK